MSSTWPLVQQAVEDRGGSVEVNEVVAVRFVVFLPRLVAVGPSVTLPQVVRVT